MSILNNEYMICCMIFFFVHSVTAFKRGPHGRLVFAKCVLPSVNKVYYYNYYFIITFIVRCCILIIWCDKHNEL